MRHTLLILLASGLLTAGCGNAQAPMPTAPPAAVKVDIADVVADGNVTPVDGITSAGQPSAEALAVFRDSGYTAVIDLRGPGEDRGFDERAAVESLGMQYIALPIVGGDAISYASARQLDRLIEAQEGPVLVHCGSGNRVGALLALAANLDGADDETAVAIGRDAGLTSLEPIVLERLTEGPPVD